MRLEYFPYYCGGRILTGFFNSALPDDEVIKQSLEHQVKYKEAYDALKLYNTGYYYAPKDQHKFYELIEKLIRSENGTNNPTVGVIVAVTNKNQLIQAGYLQEIGFKKIGSYNKYKAYQSSRENPTHEATCVLWSVDVHNVLMPKLEELKLIEEKKNEPNKRVFKST